MYIKITAPLFLLSLYTTRLVAIPSYEEYLNKNVDTIFDSDESYEDSHKDNARRQLNLIDEVKEKPAYESNRILENTRGLGRSEPEQGVGANEFNNFKQNNDLFAIPKAQNAKMTIESNPFNFNDNSFYTPNEVKDNNTIIQKSHPKPWGNAAVGVLGKLLKTKDALENGRLLDGVEDLGEATSALIKLLVDTGKKEQLFSPEFRNGILVPLGKGNWMEAIVNAIELVLAELDPFLILANKQE